MEYLLKASAVIAIFYICYKLFLQGETFFESNRWFLLTGLIFAFAIPLVVIPIHITVESIPLENIMISSDNSPIGIVEKPFDILKLISIIYLFGVVIFLGKALLQFGSLKFLLFSNNKKKQGHYTFIKTNSNTAPFSFFKWIVYNPKQFNKDELQQVITHEKVHARQYHSLDIIVTQISSIVFWFNPFVWLYKKALQQNLEFIADKNTQEQINCKKSYQHLLLKTSVPHYKMALVNNFYNSLIKKRIVMLHKSKSNKFRVWKYALILPVLALFLMNFSTKEIITYTDESSNSKNLINESAVNTDEIEERLINKDFSKADLEQVKEAFTEKGVKLKFSGIKRNSVNEIIAIKIEAKSDSANAKFEAESDKPISNLLIKYNSEDDSIFIGSVSYSISSIYFSSDDGTHKIQRSGKGNPVFVYRSNDSTKIIKSSDSIILKGNLVIRSNNLAADTLWIEKNKILKAKEILRGNNTFVISGVSREEIDSFPFIIKGKDGNKIKGYKYKDGNVKIWNIENDTIYNIKNNGKNLSISNKEGKQPLIILDGKEIINKKLDALVKPNNIESINVLKGAAAIKLYGDKGENGVVEIYSKRRNKKIKPSSNEDINIDELINWATTVIAKGNNPVESFNDSGKTPLFILNNKEVSKKEIDNLDSQKINTIIVLKGDAATKKYGKKGKDGAVIITTKNK